MLGAPVSWRSKLQKSVSLSSSEVEYIALSKAVKEVMFVAQLLESIQVDIVGAIFMASNITTTSPTKHVDIRYNYVNEYVEDEIVKIIFVVS